MKVLEVATPNSAGIKEIPRPSPGPEELLIRVMACGICGTDIHIFRGEYLGDYPIVPGHEFAGIVEEVGSSVTKFKPGDRVSVEPNICCNNCYNCLHNRQNFCLNWQAIGVTRLGGMAEYVVAPEENTFDIGELAFEKGAFMEPLSCTIYGLEKVPFRLGDRVAILGAGPIGLIMLQLIRHMGGVYITVVDKNRARLEAAGETGAYRTFDSLDELEGDHYDVVVDATGSIQVMSRSIDFARHGGTVLLFGVPPSGKMMEIEPFVLFRKGLHVMSSFTSVRNSYQAVSMLQSGIIDLSPLISHTLPLEDFQRGVELIEKGAEQVRKVLILPNGE
jgi:2-desacetyl-2-hydroxyethyl bacteriochlorophyllide A dehydrogenase